MARLGMLYSITGEEVAALREQPQEDIYRYMLDEIEGKYYNTAHACELNKA